MSNEHKSMRPTTTIVFIAVAAAALLLGVWGGRYLSGGATPESIVPEDFPGTVLPQGRPLGTFSLTDGNGAVFDNSRLQGKWSLLFFGYTHCPDVCPTTLTLFDRVDTLLQQDPKGADDVQFVFVSVDPERDDPKQLREYVAYFNPGFIGVTGPEPDLRPLTAPLGAVYQKIEPKDGGKDYLVNHTSAVFLIDPQGRFKAVFSAPHDAQKIARGLDMLR